jgi:hypothetical protein
MYDTELSQIINRAMARLQADLAQNAPFMAGQVYPWLKQLAGQTQPEDYFKHPLAFPALLLPWWAERTLGKGPDIAFQSNLVYSTINGYYYIRLIDNLMDGHATIELKLLPALNFFHTRFQQAYQPYFAADHPFWTYFTATWFHSGDVTMHDAALTDINEAQFKQIAAQKICAAKIPLAAVWYRSEQLDCLTLWSHLVDLLGCWHQMHNDLFSWHRDETRQTCTYFLSEARRRRNSDEPTVAWVAREGFAWAIAKLQSWMSELKAFAGQLRSPDLGNYLENREALLLEQKEMLVKGLQSLAALAAAKSDC